MRLLHVWLRGFDPAPPVRVGRLVVSAPDPRQGGRVAGEFEYAADYLKRSDAFPLDPVALPLRHGPFRAADPHSGLHGVFQEALPDAWGRALLCRRHAIPRAEQRDVVLLAHLGGEGMGALLFSSTKTCPAAGSAPAGLMELPDLLEAALRFETDPDALTPEIRRLLVAGSSPGGTRPKVLIEEGETSWIAKLPSGNDRLDMVGIEAATLATAVDAGLNVPPFRLLPCGSRKALLIERFDVTPEGGRRHRFSARTLLGLASHDYHQVGYGDLFEQVARISDRPADDLPALFRQTVFNAAIGNTDDHLKNFSVHRDRTGWRLTPAYDLMPDTEGRREHTLHFGSAGYRPTYEALRALGRRVGLGPKQAARIIGEVCAAVEGFAGHCRTAGVPDSDIALLRPRLLPAVGTDAI